MKYALVFDLGTGSIKASLFSEDGKSLKSVNEDYPTYHQENNIHEQNPFDWWEHLKSSALKLLEGFEYKKDIIGIAISGHSLGVVPVDENGNLLTNRTPIWSDSRGDKIAEEFFKNHSHEEWFNKTGNGFPPGLYPLFKISWLKNNQRDLYDKTYKFIGTKDYLNMKLCGVIATDNSYASGSGLYDLGKHEYIKEYADQLGVDFNKFPEIIPSDSILGKLLPEVSQELGLSSETMVLGGGVDNACMTLGAGCYEEGQTYLSLGSSAWAACSSYSPNLNYEKKVYAWEHVVNGMYVPSCGIFSAGTSFEWVRTTLLNNLSYNEINELVANTPAGSNGVIFNPVMAKGSAVDADENMKGGWVNIDLNASKGDLLRSVYEGIAYDVDLAFQSLSNIKIKEPLIAVGGGSNSDIWLNIYSNILNRDIVVSEVKREAATLACAGLVFKGLNIWKDYSIIGQLTHNGKIIKKDAKTASIYEKEKERFKLACKQAAEIYK